MDSLEQMILELSKELTSVKANVSINRYAIVGLWTIEKLMFVFAFNKIFKIDKK